MVCCVSLYVLSLSLSFQAKALLLQFQAFYYNDCADDDNNNDDDDGDLLSAAEVPSPHSSKR